MRRTASVPQQEGTSPRGRVLFRYFKKDREKSISSQRQKDYFEKIFSFIFLIHERRETNLFSGENGLFESSIMSQDLFEPFQEVSAFSFFVVFIVHIWFASSSHSGCSVEFKTTSEANTFHGSCCTVGMKKRR